VKLLFDENLALSLVAMFADVYPHSAHVREIELKSSPDPAVWNYAAKMGYTIVSTDADFRQRSFLYGPPRKVIWIRLGNCSTTQVADLLRQHRNEIEAFGLTEEQAFRLA
jgi:predicted nuclease of predicted toxin-antitoxin system